MGRKIAGLVLVLFCITGIVSFSAFALHFENYQWGMTKQEIRRKIESKGVSLPSEIAGALVYNEMIVGQSCKVTLKFTPDSKLLYQVELKWSGTGAGQKMKQILSEKYGPPYAAGDLYKKYFWYQGSDVLTLNYSTMNTTLTYASGSIEKKRNAEDRATGKTDSDKF